MTLVEIEILSGALSTAVAFTLVLFGAIHIGNRVRALEAQVRKLLAPVIQDMTNKAALDMFRKSNPVKDSE